MTPASWGVRRMLFGYPSHSRWLSCSRRGFAEYPPPLHFTPYTFTLYTLRPTQAFPPSVMCTAVARRVSRVSMSIRARLWAVHLPATYCVLPVVWQYSRLFPFTPIGCHALADFPASIPTFTPYTLRSTPLTGIPTCCLAFEIPISKMLSLPFIL
jgi:hypothetical protein